MTMTVTRAITSVFTTATNSSGSITLAAGDLLVWGVSVRDAATGPGSVTSTTFNGTAGTVLSSGSFTGSYTGSGGNNKVSLFYYIAAGAVTSTISATLSAGYGNWAIQWFKITGANASPVRLVATGDLNNGQNPSIAIAAAASDLTLLFSIGRFGTPYTPLSGQTDSQQASTSPDANTIALASYKTGATTIGYTSGVNSFWAGVAVAIKDGSPSLYATRTPTGTVNAGDTYTWTVTDGSSAVSGVSLTSSNTSVLPNGGPSDGFGAISVALPATSGALAVTATFAKSGYNSTVDTFDVVEPVVGFSGGGDVGSGGSTPPPSSVVTNFRVSPSTVERAVSGTTVAFTAYATINGVEQIVSVTWSVLSGSGSINSTGQLYVGTVAGAITVQAVYGTFTATATIEEVTKDMDDQSIQEMVQQNGVTSGTIRFASGSGYVLVKALINRTTVVDQIMFGPGASVDIYWDTGIRTQNVTFNYTGLPA